jgi:formylglycine-generating enzyme required for sulfatase activity/serine/threonine protein kinase
MWRKEAAGGTNGGMAGPGKEVGTGPDEEAEPAREVSASESPPSNAASDILDHLQSHPGAETQYKLRGEVARGGMGAILKVWDENLRRDLAMKVVLKPGGGDEPASVDDVDPKQIKRFLEEAQVTGQLDHPGVVPVHALGLDEKRTLYFTMRLVRGRDLQKIFDFVQSGEEGWNPTRALGVMLKVCEAMAYAHSKGILHRDLKPANIMVGRFGEVYVMDWGLARVMGEDDVHDLRIDVPAPQVKETSDLDVRSKFAALDSSLKTMDGDIVGTPSYMPKEQARGRVSEMGPAADVYAVGAMLYHLLAGQVPYVAEFEKPTPLTVLRRVLEGPPPPLAELNADVPGELEAICEKAMEREAADRYESMEALAYDLRAFLEGRVVQAYETGAVAEFRKWIARNRALAAASAVALLALVIGLAVSSVLYVRADRNAELAEDRRQEAEENEQQAVAARRQADESALEALQSAELAKERQAEAEAEKVKVLRLSDVKRLEALQEEAASLWPAIPEQAEGYRVWLARADSLAERLALHREALGELRSRAFPLTSSQRASIAGFAELETARAESAPDLDRIRALEERVAKARPWAFPSTEEQWQHDVLSELVERLEGFVDSERGLLADVGVRLTFAETIEERTITGPAASAAWNEAIGSIADRDECPVYDGFELLPQLGLLPIGRDHVSGLWEFAHVQTGDVPVRDELGKLEVTGDTSIVFVLLPGGEFPMGGQAADEAAANYDPGARKGEGPVHFVELAPFFCSKYEMTQGQWVRFTGENPSAYKPGRTFLDYEHDYRHPAELVSWEESARVLGNLGLELPTEARWEYAARAGTTSVWWSGDDRDSLIGVANLADQSAEQGGAKFDAIREWPELEDGFAVHAPVGSFAPNAFGLHDVHGNVLEWCQDWRVDYPAAAPREGDGLRDVKRALYRIYRGGGFIYSASAARSAYRDSNAPDYRGSSIGLRPARSLDSDL